MIYVYKEVDGRYSVFADINGSLSHIERKKHKVKSYAIRDGVLIIIQLFREGFNVSMAISGDSKWDIYAINNKGNLKFVK